MFVSASTRSPLVQRPGKTDAAEPMAGRDASICDVQTRAPGKGTLQ